MIVLWEIFMSQTITDVNCLIKGNLFDSTAVEKVSLLGWFKVYKFTCYDHKIAGFAWLLSLIVAGLSNLEAPLEKLTNAVPATRIEPQNIKTLLLVDWFDWLVIIFSFI